MIGQTVSHYTILEKLGGGGMGVVYKAEDSKLKRTVALKFLPPELTREKDAKTRFIHEAQAASALQHNNICAIHEIDETPDGRLFISMDCYEGETLKERIAKGPLPMEEAIDIVSQTAAGLSEAHGAGMVHRDIKPANVMLTEKGAVKILDFGLAKLAGQTKVTKTGMTVGTAAYMSPEQARGDDTDSRSDIWSLGVMFYEMLAGRLPFRGEVEQAIMYSILNEDPELVTMSRGDVPIGVEDIIEKALSKDPVKRYRTMDELLSELGTQRDQIALGIKERRFRGLRRLKRRKRLVAGTVVVVILATAAAALQMLHTGSMRIDSIAVLPLENLSNDPEQEYFVDGMTDALITELSKIGALHVISRTSVMQYKGTRRSLPEIARELGVDAIVEGAVLREGPRIRITAQLIQASTDRHLWADQYVREVREVLALHSDVARAIAREVHVTLTPQEQTLLDASRAVNPEAYEHYLKGVYQYEKWTKEGFEKAIDDFQKAIEADPDYAEAYDGLADSYLWLGFLGALTPEEALSKAHPALRRALEIDDLLPQAHETLAGIKHYYDWDWLGAEAGYRRAIELDPSFVEARLEFAICLMDIGRPKEAIAEAKHAQQLAPVSLPANKTLGSVLSITGEYEQALTQYGKMAELWPDKPTVFRGLARTYWRMGRYEEAVRAHQKAMTLSGESPEVVASLDSAYSESGPKGYWEWCLRRLNGQYDRSPRFAAKYYAQLGDKDEAFVWLEKAYETRRGGMQDLKVDPVWDPLRDDPRFQDLLRRMNFPADETPE